MIEIRRGAQQANYRTAHSPDCSVVITPDPLERISSAAMCVMGLVGLVATLVLCLKLDWLGPLVTLLPFSIVVFWMGALGVFNRTEIHRRSDAWVVWNGPIPNVFEKQRHRIPRVSGERVFSEMRSSQHMTRDGRPQTSARAVVVLASPIHAERILFSSPKLDDATRIAEALQEGLPSPEASLK